MILHVDMDAFYASIEQRDFPELRGLPVLVGGTRGRGVVAAASYEARRFGCRSAMPMKEALRRCPDAVVRPTRFKVYQQAAEQIRRVFLTYTPLVEPLSLDEAFLDVHGSPPALGSAEEIGRRIKREIAEATDLVASVGIAPVKFVAKLASDHGKPDGFVMILPEEVLDFLAPLPIARLWGVGKATLPRLGALGIERVGDLRKHSREEIESRLGQLGGHIWDLAHGIDPRRVISDREAKSISHEETFPEDLTDEEELLAELHYLVDMVTSRLRASSLRATSLSLKIRFPSFQTITRQESWEEPTDQTDRAWDAARRLWLAERSRSRSPIRLLGVGLTGLVPHGSVQPSLFDPAEDDKSRRVDQTVDAIRQRFGLKSLSSADLLRRKGSS